MRAALGSVLARIAKNSQARQGSPQSKARQNGCLAAASGLNHYKAPACFKCHFGKADCLFHVRIERARELHRKIGFQEKLRVFQGAGAAAGIQRRRDFDVSFGAAVAAMGSPLGFKVAVLDGGVPLAQFGGNVRGAFGNQAPVEVRQPSARFGGGDCKTNGGL